MATFTFEFCIYDGRYLTDEDSSICVDTCDTIEEAREVKPDYGDDTVIVKHTLKKIGDRSYQVIESEIVE